MKKNNYAANSSAPLFAIIEDEEKINGVTTDADVMVLNEDDQDIIVLDKEALDVIVTDPSTVNSEVVVNIDTDVIVIDEGKGEGDSDVMVIDGGYENSVQYTPLEEIDHQIDGEYFLINDEDEEASGNTLTEIIAIATTAVAFALMIF
ncbi:MAG: hypothetical protein J6W96_05710 [Alphaproteobacteria bacterium]|nr:hypothetical protein [Alphaproteobacteria bacterium]